MTTDQDPIADREAKIAAWRKKARRCPCEGDYLLTDEEIDEAVALMRSAPQDGDAKLRELRAEIDRLRAENERLRGRDAEPFDWDAKQTVVEWVEENLPEREPRAGSKMVELHADEVVADRGEARRVAGWLKDIMAENARLQADLAAARAALGRISEVVSPCGWTNPEDVVGRVQQRAAQRKQSDRMFQKLVDDLNADLAAARADQAAMARRELEALKAWVRGGVGAPLRHYVCRVPYVRQGDTVHHIDQRLAALPAQQPEPEPDAATRDGDEVLLSYVRTHSGLLNPCAFEKAILELCRAELFRRELARGGK